MAHGFGDVAPKLLEALAPVECDDPEVACERREAPWPGTANGHHRFAPELPREIARQEREV
jgi:hypothetical protein